MRAAVTGWVVVVAAGFVEFVEVEGFGAVEEVVVVVVVVVEVEVAGFGVASLTSLTGSFLMVQSEFKSRVHLPMFRF